MKIQSKKNLSRDSLMVRYRAHNPGTGNASGGPTPSPARILQRNKFGSLQFSPPIKRKSIEIVVTSLGCCSTQSTLANVRVLFLLKGISL